MKSYLKQNWPFFVLLILALLTRFLFLSYPSEVVFDEVHFGKFVSAYFTHQYYFDIHPPLGKLMIAGFAKIFGFQGNFDFSKIGEVFDAKNLFILRFLPALFGTLFVLLIYKLVLLIGLSKKSAFLAGFLVLFDNALLTESKFVLVDMFLLFFGFLALYFFISGKQKQKILFFILSAIFAALSFSIKWTGLSFLGIILFFILIEFIKNHQVKEFLIKSTIFISIPFLIYFSIFAVHFNLLPKSGPGDAFMNSDFQNENLWQKFIELNQKMYFYSSTLKTAHPFGSKWYQWPKMQKAIWYWTHSTSSGQDQNRPRVANIYLIGNPLTWWLVAITILIGLFSLLIKKFRKKISPVIYLFLLGYFANLLPFIFINRVTFLYHYLPSLTFGILIFVLLSEKLLKNNYIYFSLLFLVFLFFIVFLPLTYGIPIPLNIVQIYKIIF